MIENKDNTQISKVSIYIFKMDYVFSNANYETEKWEEGENVIIYCSWEGGGGVGGTSMRKK